MYKISKLYLVKELEGAFVKIGPSKTGNCNLDSACLCFFIFVLLASYTTVGTLTFDSIKLSDITEKRRISRCKSVNPSSAYIFEINLIPSNVFQFSIESILNMTHFRPLCHSIPPGNIQVGFFRVYRNGRLACRVNNSF